MIRMLNQRPRLRIKPNQTDRMLDTASWILLCLLWAGSLYALWILPDRIAIHFNASGRPDGFGRKINILILPVLATILLVGMTLLNRHPYLFNYAQKITEDNAEHQYTMATRLLRLMKLVIVFVFIMITFLMYEHQMKATQGLGWWFLPVVELLFIVPVIIYLIRFTRKKI